MKKFANWALLVFVFFAIALSFSSCISVKELKYFQDIPDSTRLSVVKLPQYTVPVIHKGDLVSVLFYTTDPTAVANLNLPVMSSTVAASSVSGADQNGYLVDENGEIEIPQIGKVNVENLTTDQAREVIKTKSLNNLVNPLVIVKPKGIKIQVLGEVSKPGILFLPPGKATIIDAIGYAGDLTAYGRKDNILLLRTNSDNSLSQIRISLKDSNILGSKYYYLMNNDVLIIEPTKGKAISSDAAFSRNISLLTVGLSVLTTLIVVFRR
jgi:polysaccharide export outer membrane protein